MSGYSIPSSFYRVSLKALVFDGEPRLTRYVRRAEFETLEMHRSDQCLQDSAELLFRR